MPEHMYRFRSIENLLGKGDRLGELEGQYIFFAAPETLNDPLEGYREMYWSGDRVLWRNLLKHYITTLTIKAFQFIDEDLFVETFPIKHRINQMPPEVIEVVKICCDAFFEDQSIRRHIEVLSINKRHVKRAELQCHLQLIHKFALYNVGHTIDKKIRGIETEPKPFNKERHISLCKAFLDEIEKSLKLIENQTASDIEQGHQEILTALNEMNFNVQYHQWKRNGGDPWFEISMSFPQEYLQNIGKLNFPEWYVACFMSECTDSSIWGTYGNNHSAVCLKFKTSGSPGALKMRLKMPSGVNQKGVVFSDTDVPLHKVCYDENFVEIDFFASLGGVTAPDLGTEWFRDREGNLSARSEILDSGNTDWQRNYNQNYQKSITVKMGDWHKENEFRLTMHSYLLDIQNPKNRCIQYDFNSLDGVIFGINTPPKDKMKIITIIENLCIKNSRKDFNFYQARYDNFQRKICIDQVKIREVGKNT